MAVSQVQVVSVPVDDPEVARDFYVDVLGFELLSDTQMGDSMRWIQVRPTGGGTALTLVTWFPSMPAGSLRGMVLETAELDSEVERLTALGVLFDGPIQDAPWGRYAQCTDPAGNGLILQTTRAAYA